MLQLDKVQTLFDVTVYGDDKSPNTFYLLANAPTLRLGPDGKPDFKFVKYRDLRKDGDDVFGGLVSFSTELSLPEETRKKVIAALQDQVNALFRGRQAPQVVAGNIMMTKGAVSLSLGDGDGKLVEKVRGATKPSLYGANVAVFWMELSKLGSTVFEQALQGEGGFISVIYDLKGMGMLPETTAFAVWRATQSYSFFQDIDTEDNFWSEDSYTETIRESLVSSDFTDTQIDYKANPNLSAEDNQKILDNLTTTLQNQLEQKASKMVLEAIQKVDPNVKDLHEGQDIEDIKRNISKSQMSDVQIYWRAKQSIEADFSTSGQLPNITSMTGPDGEKFKWEDYAIEVDGDDPFFRTLNVSLAVNADFENLGIFNVEAKIIYPHGAGKVEEFTFKGPNDVGRFRTFLVEDKKTYKYSYQVNYKGGQVYQSGDIETDDTQLTVNVTDLGVFAVDVAAGDLNFTQVKQALLTIRYSDSGVSPIEQQYTLKEGATDYELRKVTLKPRTKPYAFKVKYFMADGKELETGWKEQDAPQLYVNDPFSATAAYNIRAIGDLENRISNIAVDLVYADEAAKYTQKGSFTLSKDTPFIDWSFPVLDEEAGKVTYTATINYADGTSADVPKTQADRSTIQLGDVVRDRIEITVNPALLDFAKLKLVNISLKYIDEANDVSERKDFTFKTADEEAKTWVVDQKDKKKIEYAWKAMFFLNDGTKKELPETKSSDSTLFPELPA